MANDPSGALLQGRTRGTVKDRLRMESQQFSRCSLWHSEFGAFSIKCWGGADQEIWRAGNSS